MKPTEHAHARFGLPTAAAASLLHFASFVVVLLAVVAACGAPETLPPGSVLRWKMEDGTMVGGLARGEDTAVVLVYKPSDCFTCGGELSHWTAVTRGDPQRLHLLLTEKPSASEARQMVLFRLKPRGYLAPGASRLETPRVYRVHGGRMVDSAVGTTRQKELIARLASRGGELDSIRGSRPEARNFNSGEPK